MVLQENFKHNIQKEKLPNPEESESKTPEFQMIKGRLIKINVISTLGD
jgi:hypothetical protein